MYRNPFFFLNHSLNLKGAKTSSEVPDDNDDDDSDNDVNEIVRGIFKLNSQCHSDITGLRGD